MPIPATARKRNLALLALTVGAAPMMAWADESEQPYFEELPTVLTASRLPQPLNEAPGAVTVIDRDFIKATGYRDLARIFRLVPGMQVGQERGNAQWVTYHGLSSTNPSEMQVLVDGRSVYSPASFGGVDWTTLPVGIDEIERIEIVRGSNPVTYGANAFLGVINIITRHVDDQSEPRVAANLGSAGIRDFAGAVTGKIAGMGLRLNMQHQHDRGFAGMNDSRDVSLLTLRGDYRISGTDELSLRMGASESETDQGYPNSVNRNNDLRTRYSQNYSLHTQWTHAPDSSTEQVVHFYHNSEHISEHWTGLGVAIPPWYPDGLIVPLNMDRRAARDHLEFQRRTVLSPSQQFVWGAEGRRDEVDAPLLYANRHSVVTTLYRSFGNLEWKLAPSWQLTTGAALERFEREPTHLAPRTFLNWQVSSSDTLRAGYARAWGQRPTFEKEGDVRATEARTGVLVAQPYVPNPDLRQQRVDSVELGYLGRFRPLASSLDVRVFREHITGFIYRQATVSSENPLLNTANDSAQYVNSARPVTLTGVEYQLKASPWSEGEVWFSHTLTRTTSQDDAFKYRVAPYVASLSWRQGWGGNWSSMLTGLRTGPLAGGDGMVPIYSYVARAYTTFDMRIAYTTRRNGRKVEYSLNAINLGERHQEIADRSQQSLVGSEPANRVSPMVYAGISVEL